MIEAYLQIKANNFEVYYLENIAVIWLKTKFQSDVYDAEIDTRAKSTLK